jgi:hypothetical protein
MSDARKIRVRFLGGPEHGREEIIPGDRKIWRFAELLSIRPMSKRAKPDEAIETREHVYEIYPLFENGLPKFTGRGIHEDLCRTIRERG